MKNDQDRMKCIISETIVALCNSGLDFSSELSVEGLLGITLDGRDILLVNINEVIKPCATRAKLTSSRTIVSDKEGILSEVSTSSDPTRTVDPFVERHNSSTDSTYNTHIPAQAHLSDASGKITTGKREDGMIRTPQVKVKSEPEEVISIHDDEEGDSICTDAKSEYHHQFGNWTESFDDYTDTESAQPISSETSAQCSVLNVIQRSQSNSYISDQFSEIGESTTDGRGSMLNIHQENVLSTPTVSRFANVSNVLSTPTVSRCANVSNVLGTPTVSRFANVSPQKVSTAAANMCRHSQVKTDVFLLPFFSLPSLLHTYGQFHVTTDTTQKN